MDQIGADNDSAYLCCEYATKRKGGEAPQATLACESGRKASIGLGALQGSNS